MKTFFHISLIVLLLMSMSDINKVVLLGYTVMTDSQKASHFCTCTGCNHHSDHHGNEDEDDDIAEMCIIEMNPSAHVPEKDPVDQKADVTEPGCCSSTNPDTEQTGISICQCNHDTIPSGSIAIFNTIDKTALFPSAVIRDFRKSSQSRFSFVAGIPIPFLKEIFHPPK